jgi:chromosome partitioning protein
MSGYTVKQCIQTTSFGTICPSDDSLYGVDSQIRAHPGIYKYIKKAIQDIESEYDFIIFDTPPVFGLIVGNVLMCCDYVVVPLECELFGVQGLFDFNNIIKEFQEDNPKLKILGLLKVKYKKNQKLTKDLEENVLPQYAAKIGTKIFKSTIRESVKLKESVMLRMRLFDHARGSTVESDYNTFVDELLEEVKADGHK